MADETTKKFIQLQDAQGTPIFPRVDLSNVENAADFVRSADIADFATSSDVETAFSEYTTEVVDEKLKSYSTTEQVNSAIATAVGNIEQFGKVIVPRTAEQSIEEALAAVENPKDNAIYLVPLMAGDAGYEESNGIHIEYLYVSNNWESIGSTKTNLEDYYTKAQVGELKTDAEGATEAVIENNKLNAAYAPELKFQGQSVGNLFNSLNIIGIGNVTVDEAGNVTLRLGENLNCSLWNGTDGISTATVSSAKSDSGSATVSGDYSTVSAGGSKVIFDASAENITANAGAAASTTAGATSANGNEVHFDDNATGYFLVNILEGKNTEATVYQVGPVTANATLSATLDGTAVSGISCAITNFGEEPKKATGATGYAGNVNFTFKPYDLFSASTDFKLVSIEQVKIDAEGKVTKVATWTNSTTNGVYFCLKDTATPATPSAAGFAFNSVASATKKISGVTYITTSATFNVTASGITNIGYPANAGNYLDVDYSGNAWMTSYDEKSTSTFTTYTTAKDATMTYKSANYNPLRGMWGAPQVKVAGKNFGKTGTAKTSAETVKLLVCDANGRVSDNNGSFTSASEDLADDALMVYNGRLEYPNRDFSGYNAGVGGLAADLKQPNYKGTTGDRSYTKTFTLGGTKPNCAITIGHDASIKDALTAGTLKVEIRTVGGTWKDASENGLGQPSSSYGDTSTTLNVAFDNKDDYPNATSGTAVRITMSSNVAAIRSIALA